MMRKTAKTIVLLTMIFVMAISVGMMAMACEIGDDVKPSDEETYYTVLFDSLGGTEVPAISIADNQLLGAPTSPTKQGFYFAGWYIDPSFSRAWNFAEDKVTANITLYAKWGCYTITTNTNMTEAGTYTQLTESIKSEGESVSLTAVTNNGYTWLGWYDGDTKLTDELSYTFTMPAESKTYTAVWTAYTITTNSNMSGAGTYTIKNQEKVTAGNSVTLEATTNSGYTFVGWYDDDTKLSGEMTYTFTMTANNKTYTAKWMECPVTLTKNIAEAGSVSGVEGATAVGKSATITATTNRGYTFVGWYDGDTKLTDELSYTFTMPADSKTYTAKWTYYTVTANTNMAEAGTYTIKNQEKVTAGNSVTIEAVTNNGYTWVGWYDGDTKLTDEMSYTFTMIAENKTYTAKWMECPISLDKNIAEAGAVSGIEGATVLGKPTTIMATSNGDYTFVGWYDGDTKLTDELTYTFIMTAESKTYTAKWIECPLTIEKDVEEGGVLVGFEGENVAGKKMTVTVASNLGYEFVGWYDGENELTDQLSYTFIMQEENKTLTAKWRVKDEMSNFYFTSSLTECSIYDVDNSSVQQIFIPNYVTSIEANILAYCSELETIRVEQENKNYCSVDGILYNANMTYIVYVPKKISGAISIPNTVVRINKEFADRVELSSIGIGTGITFIDSDAFSGCASLAKVDVSDLTKWCEIHFYNSWSNPLTTGALLYIDGVRPSGDIDLSTVKKIPAYTFKDCDQLNSVTFGSSLTKVDVDAFGGCSGITQVKIDNISNWSSINFANANANPLTYAHDLYLNGKLLVSMEIPAQVEAIGPYAFSGCSANTISMTNRVKSIGKGAFLNCSNVQSITIPNKVTIIEEESFAGCSSMETLTIPNGVTNIKSRAFENCSSLTSVLVPDSVTSMGERAFLGCSGLVNITIPFVGENKDGSGRTEFSYIFSVPNCLKSVTVTGGKSIGDYAFSGCRGLTSITILEGVMSIGKFAFYGCSSLTNITIPNGVTSIGEKAFYDCTGLTSVVIPASVTSVTSIGAECFRGCNSLIEITMPLIRMLAPLINTGTSNTGMLISSGNRPYFVPTSLKTINAIGERICDYALDGFYMLENVTIANSVTSIGSSAFRGCSSLTSITIPDSVKSIGKDAFSSCALDNIYVEEGNDNYCASGKCLIEKASNTLIVGTNNSIIPQNVIITNIGDSAFSGCSSLTNITIPDSVTSIGDYAFSGCSSLTSITIPNGVTTIRGYTFFGCSSLTSITIPDSVTSIGSYAFSDCSSLTTIGFDGTMDQWDMVEKYDDWDGGKTYQISCKDGIYVNSVSCLAFEKYNSQGSMYVPNAYRISGVSEEGRTASQIGIPTQYLGLPVTSIKSNAFENCSNLTSIIIPDSVTSIGSGAFSGCSSLTSIIVREGNAVYHSNGNCLIETESKALIAGCKASEIPTDGSVTSIAPYAFSGSALTNITIPDGVTSIGEYAFSDCSGLISVSIPQSAREVREKAFSGCSSLAEMTLPQIGYNDGGTNRGAYTYLLGWIFSDTSFEGSIEITQHYYGLFGKLTTRIGYIPASLKSLTIIGEYIAWNTFRGCSTLSNICIGDGVTSISNGAFLGCSSLTNISISDSVTSIGESAFDDTEWYNNQADGLIYVGKVAYKYKGTMPSDTSIVIKKGTLGIAANAFGGCSGLTSITIPDSVKTVESSAFDGCSGLTRVDITNMANWCEIRFSGASANPLYYAHDLYLNDELVADLVIPNDVTTIREYTFSGCSSLINITIPSGVTSIGYYAFLDCGLSSITISDSVTSIVDRAFSGCGSLTSIVVQSGNAKYHSNGNCLIETGSKTLIAGCKSSVIPADGSVTSIGNYAFYNCNSLTSITIPSGVTSIGNYAFSYCSGMSSIKYEGTQEEWAAISKGSNWNSNTGEYTIDCTDGNIAKS